MIDAWFDSGSMPFAQFGAPHRNADEAGAAYPADFICEAIDQTRGWFYSLMAIGTLVFDRSSYRTVLCLGHILAEDGRKMSKHLGNILEPIPLMDRHGADALRWFMLCSGSPWAQRRVGHKVLDEIASKVLRTYWSVASFQSLYARANDWDVAHGRRARPSSTGGRCRRCTGSPPRSTPRSRTSTPSGPDARSSAYIDDLSNWYVRRSRRRFWDGDPAALSTLHECLHVLTRLLAPFVPFVTEKVWGGAVRLDRLGRLGAPGRRGRSPTRRWSTRALSEQVALVRRLVELGRSARADSKMKTRQPLAQALISAPGWAALPESLRDEVREELNVVDAGRAGRRRRAGRALGEAELPRAGPALRQAHPGGRRRRSRPPIRPTFVAAYRAGTAHGRGRRRRPSRSAATRSW